MKPFILNSMHFAEFDLCCKNVMLVVCSLKLMSFALRRWRRSHLFMIKIAH